MPALRIPQPPKVASSISKESIRLRVLNNSSILEDSDFTEISDSL
jgi:hypothetical protein